MGPREPGQEGGGRAGTTVWSHNPVEEKELRLGAATYTMQDPLGAQEWIILRPQKNRFPGL